MIQSDRATASSASEIAPTISPNWANSTPVSASNGRRARENAPS